MVSYDAVSLKIVQVASLALCGALLSITITAICTWAMGDFQMHLHNFGPEGDFTSDMKFEVFQKSTAEAFTGFRTILLPDETKLHRVPDCLT